MNLKDVIQKVDLNYLAKKYGEEYTKWLKRLLIEADKKASGRLIKSIDYKIVKSINSYLLTIQHEDYLIFVNDGRKKGAKQPPISAIKKWLKQRNITPNNKDIDIDTLAFLIARGISKNGIKPTNVIERAKELTKKNIKLSRLEQKDVDNILDEIKKDLISIGTSNGIQIKKK